MSGFAVVASILFFVSVFILPTFAVARGMVGGMRGHQKGASRGKTASS